MKNTLFTRSILLLSCAALLLPAYLSANDPVYFETAFTDYELGNIHEQHDWTENSSNGATGLVTIVEQGSAGAPNSPSATPNLMKVVRPDTTHAPWARQTFFDYTGALRSGTIYMSYTAALDWGSSFTAGQITLGGSAMGLNGIKTGFHFGESTGATHRYLYVLDSTGQYHYLDADPDSEGLTSITRNAFYRFDVLLDIDTKDYTVTVYDMDDRKLDSVTLNDWQRGSEEIMFNRIHVGFPGGSANDTLYIDNFLVTVPEPGMVALGTGFAAILLCCFSAKTKRKKS